jgi:hypothetical protein
VVKGKVVKGKVFKDGRCLRVGVFKSGRCCFSA